MDEFEDIGSPQEAARRLGRLAASASALVSLSGIILSGCGEIPCEKTRSCALSDDDDAEKQAASGGKSSGKKGDGDDEGGGGQGGVGQWALGGETGEAEDDSSMGGQGGAEPIVAISLPPKQEEEQKELEEDDVKENEVVEIPIPIPIPILICGQGEVVCVEVCIDPSVDPVFCGAVGDCAGDQSGQSCTGEQACIGGLCRLQCPEGRIPCDGACIDPQTNEDFCGAAGWCEAEAEGERGSACEEEAFCARGACLSWGASVETLVAGGGTLGLTLDEKDEVIALALIEYQASSISDIAAYRINAQDAVLALLSPSDPAGVLNDFLGMAFNLDGEGAIYWSGPDAEGRIMAQMMSYDLTTENLLPAQSIGVPAEDALSLDPRLAIDGAGNLAMSWIDQGQSASALSARRTTSANTWTGSAPVSDQASAPLSDPSWLLPLGEGDFLSIWQQGSGGGTNIWSSYAALGQAWTTPVLVTSIEGVFVEGAVQSASNEQGQAVLAWADADGVQVWRFERGSGGQGWDAPVLRESGTASLAAIDLDKSGGLALVWAEVSAPQLPGRLYGLRTSFEAEDLPLLSLLSESLEVPGPRPQVQADEDGNFFVLWSESVGEESQLKVSRFDLADAAFSEEHDLSPLAEASLMFSLAVNGSGAAVVGFHEEVEPIELGAVGVIVSPLHLSRFH